MPARVTIDINDQGQVGFKIEGDVPMATLLGSLEAVKLEVDARARKPQPAVVPAPAGALRILNGSEPK